MNSGDSFDTIKGHLYSEIAKSVATKSELLHRLEVE